MNQKLIRNIAIIAHVDHGKTTLVDQFFKQSGMYRDNQTMTERLMDSLELERERGITIAAKNGSFRYGEYVINIIDTPGHADFGGQVERVLRMADGCLLLVDAQEGPMPQTYFVLKKALAVPLPVLVVINKIDKPAAQPLWAVDKVFDLFVKLEAPDELLDFPIVFASGKGGYALDDAEDSIERASMVPLFEKIVTHIPPPPGNPEDVLQFQVNTIDYSVYLGKLGIGKVINGAMNINQKVAVAKRDGSLSPARITKIFRFERDQKVPIEKASAGEIVAISGLNDITVGVTFTDPEDARPLPLIHIDPPTISMHFIPNDSPFAGQEGKFMNSRDLKERLFRETLADVALSVESLGAGAGFKVSGRGELHLSILMEKMRREGYEFQVSRPEVIMKDVGGQLQEPYEELTLDVDEKYQGTVIEKLGRLKGEMLEMTRRNDIIRLIYKVPTRGLIGFRSEFLSDSRGTGVMNYVFSGYGPFAGEISNRISGALVAKDACTTVAYALFNLQERGRLFLGPGVKVYGGQIIGEHCRPGDLVVNPAKGKKLNNMRAAGSDENVILTPPHRLTLEDCIAFINDDELVEVTPATIRMRERN
jgi:GTP-binding protein